MTSGEFVADLLRHGEAGAGGFRGRLDDPLTLAGWEQMWQAVRRGGPWQAGVSPPLARCAAFAEEFAGENGLPLACDERLAELDFGAWEGLSAAQVMQTPPEALARFWSDPWAYPPPGGESLAAFERRVRSALGDLARRFDGRCVLVVTHGGVIRLALCLSQGLKRGELLRLDVPHASLHRIVLRSCKHLQLFTEESIR